MLFAAVRPPAARAAAGVNPQLNYQGKLTTPQGDAVPDDGQDFVFKLYTSPSGGSPIWTETWNASTRFITTMASGASAGATSLTYTNDASEANLAVGDTLYNTSTSDEVIITAIDTAGNVLTVSPTAKAWAAGNTITTRIATRNGLFSARLGSITSLATTDFNQDALYLGVAVGSDPEMTPRKRFTAVPQAFNANALGGVTSTQFLRSDVATTLMASSTAAALTLQQAIGLNAGAALKISSAPVASNAASLLQLSPSAISGGNANGTFIGVNPAAFSGDFMRFQVGGVNKFFLDSSGSVSSAGSLTLSALGGGISYVDGGGLLSSAALSGLVLGNGTGAPTATTTLAINSGGTGAGALTAGQLLQTSLTGAYTTTGTVSVAFGGTGATSLTANGFLLGGGAAAITSNALTGIVIGAGASAPSATTTLAINKGGTGAGALTAGSVIFAGASSAYTQNNANFFWDNTLLRHGIGTASPGAMVSVSSTGSSTTGVRITANSTAAWNSGNPFLIENNAGTKLFTVSPTGSIVHTVSSDSNAAYQFQNAAGTTFFDLDTTNQRLGLRTLTPNAFISVSSSASVTGIRITINPTASNSANTANPFLIDDVNGAHIFRISATGEVFSANYGCADIAGTCYESGVPADLAELTAVVDDIANYHNGDLVRQSPSDPQKVERAKKPYDTALYGVVTDRGTFLGAPTWLEDGVNAVRVSLVGYVRARVSAANGAIEPGDWLTSSDNPGVAVKALNKGRVIGIAREAFDGSADDTGLIEILVQPSFWLGSDSGVIAAVAGPGTSDAASQPTVTVSRLLLPSNTTDLLMANIVEPLKSLGIVVEQGIIRIAKIIADTVRTGHLEVGSPSAPSGITLYDTATGEPYCVTIENGELARHKGACEQATQTPVPVSANESVASPIQTPTPTPTPVPETSPTASPSPTPAETSTPSPFPELSPSGTLEETMPSPSADASAPIVSESPATEPVATPTVS